MKQFSIVALLMVLASAAFAESETWSRPGYLTAQAGLGLHWGGLGQLEVGADYAVAQLPLGSAFPLDFGVAARLAAAPSLIGAGAFGTLHYSPKALRTGQDWLDRFELGAGIGLALLPQIGLDGFGVVSFHFDRRWAVLLEGAAFGGVIGVSYRF